MVETIGFIISLLSLLYLFTRPDKGSLKKGDQEISLPPSPPLKRKEPPKKRYLPSTERGPLVHSIEEGRLKGEREERRVQPLTKSHEQVSLPSHSFSASQGSERKENQGRSRIQSAVHRLGNRRDLLIYQEIMGRPKSLRSDLFPQ